MKTLLLILAALPAFALSNAVSINNLSASAQPNRTWNIHRYFADKEICGQPQPYTGGSAITYWQSDVTSRWPADSGCAGGYARTAMISFELTVAASSSAVVEFRASSNGCNLGPVTTCNASILTSAQLLDFDAGGGVGSWGLKVSATTGGITLERSARAMIAANQYQVLKSGPLFTEVLVREGPQSVTPVSQRNFSLGWRCTSNCTAPYDTATWTDDINWYSIRPTFLLRFYRRWGRVEGDSILQNAWLDRHVDQRMDQYKVLHGTGEATSCYAAPAAFVIPARSTVWDGPCWSTDPGDSTNTKIDLNTAYLIYSKAVPEYDQGRGIGEAAINLELNSASTTASQIGWNTSDKGETTTALIAPHLGYGQWERAASAGGNGHWIAVIPRGSARYLLSMSNDMLKVVMGGARAYLHFPFTHLGTATTDFYTAGGSASAFGQPISLQAHPTFSTAEWVSVQTTDKPRHPLGSAPAMVQCQDTSAGTLTWCSSVATNTVNKFGMDLAHMVNPFWVPWLITGKHFLTEAMWHQAAWASSNSPTVEPMSSMTYERVGIKGYVYSVGNTIRSTAWTIRIKAAATVATPDAFSTEKAYFKQMVTGSLAIDEGHMSIVDGSYPPPDPANADGRYGCPNKFSWLYSDHLWCVGRYMIDQGRSNPVGYPNWYGDTSAYWPCRNCRQEITSGPLSPWMVSFAVTAYAWLDDLGFPSRPMFHSTVRWLMGMTFDSAGIPGPLAYSYHIPMRNTAGTGYLQSWAEVKSARTFTARVGRAFGPTDTTFRVANALSSSLDNLGYNATDFYYQTVMPAKVGSEIFDMQYGYPVITTALTIDPVLDQATVSSHTFLTNDLVRLHSSTGDSGLTSSPLSVVSGGSMCYTEKIDCDVYVKVISPTLLEFYTDPDLAPAHLVDWTAAQTGVVAGQTIIALQDRFACGVPSGAICRGRQGTNATSHAVGETFEILNSVMAQGHMDPQVGNGAGYYASFAAAAERGTVYTDSVTGRQITGARAFETNRRWYYKLIGFGGGTSCSDLTIQNCDNPQFSYKSRGTPSNVRLVGSSMLYNAPDGAACRYATSTTPFASTDDSGDALSTAGSRARSIPLTGGTHHYRISCGATGRVTGQVTVP